MEGTFLGGNVVKTDKGMGVSRFWEAHARADPTLHVYGDAGCPPLVPLRTARKICKCVTVTSRCLNATMIGQINLFLCNLCFKS